MDHSPAKTFVPSSGGDPCYDVQKQTVCGLQQQDVQTITNGCPRSLNITEDLYGKRDNSSDKGKRVQIKGTPRNGLFRKSGEKKITVDEFVSMFCGELIDQVVIEEEQKKMIQEKELDAYLGNLVTRTLECLLEDETKIQPEDDIKAGQIFQDGMEVFIDTLLQRVTEAVLKQHHPGIAINGKQQHQMLGKVSKSSGKWTGQSLEVFQGNFETTIAWEWVDGLEESKDTHEIIAKTDSEGRVWVGQQVEKSMVLQGKVTESEKPNCGFCKHSKTLILKSDDIEISLNESSMEEKHSTWKEGSISVSRELKSSLTDDEIKPSPLCDNLQQSIRETRNISKDSSVIEAGKGKWKYGVVEAKPVDASFCTFEGATKNTDQSPLGENISTQKFVDTSTLRECEELTNYSGRHREDKKNIYSSNVYPNLTMASVDMQSKADDRPLQTIDAPSKNRTARVPKIVKAVTSAHRRTSGTQLATSKTSLVGNSGLSQNDCAINLQVSKVSGTIVKKAEHTNQTDTSKMADNKDVDSPTAESERLAILVEQRRVAHTVNTMASVGERRIAAVLGAAVADSAAQPLHWNYKKDKLDALLHGKQEVEFWEPSQNPFYRIATGRHSCYGDQAGVILRSLVHCKDVDVSHLKKEHYKKFGPESEYDSSTINQYKNKEDAGITLPIYSPWKHASIKDFIKNHEAGLEETGSETDGQIDCVTKIAPVVAMFAGHPDLLMKVEEVIRVTQQADICISTGLAAARILEHFILHGPDPEAINIVIQELSNPKRKNPQDLDKALAGQLRAAIQQTEKPHVTTVREVFVMS